MLFSWKELVRITSGSDSGKDDPLIRVIFLDSRSLPSTENALYIALKGPNHNGHRFIPELHEKGFKYFLVQDSYLIPQGMEGSQFLRVPDPLSAMQQIAAAWRSKFTIPVVGITGSNGKTIIKEWLSHLLSFEMEVVKSPRSYNSQIGVPLSVLLLEPSAGVAIFEAGISRPGEMKALQNIIQPTIGIFSNLGPAHQENFDHLRQKLTEKMTLFHGVEELIYCHDHPPIHEAAMELSQKRKVRLVAWSRKSQADLEVKEIIIEGCFSRIRANFRGQEGEIVIPFTDEASLENALHCWTFLWNMGYEPQKLADGFRNLSPVAMRMEMKHGINGCTLIDDAYSSDLISLSVALDVLSRQNQNASKTVILSDILQAGRPEEDLYQDVSRLLDSKKISRLVGIGPALVRNKALFGVPASFYENTEAFLDSGERNQFQDEAILLKGARMFGFERISEWLDAKRHQTRLEINLNAIAHNLHYFRSLLKPETKVMAMVKALSYGSGTYEISNLLQHHKADYLAVAYTDEGIALRKAGLKLPIMVMNPEPASFPMLAQFRLEPELYSLYLLQSFIRWCESNGWKDFPVHLKMDTGMHRLGFMENEMEHLIEKLRSTSALKIKSVFSHLAGSEDPFLDEFTREQIRKFELLSGQLSKQLSIHFLRHILNSAGIERFPEAQMDMVRLGIGLYGISTIHSEKLMETGSLRTVISQVKRIKAGETVGYNRKGVASRATDVAIVPIGYADGINRKLGNGCGIFRVNGHPAPVIGNICMDMCMLDVTGIKADEGDEVLIFGPGAPVVELAKKLETIPYEILTSISGRVKRIYYQE